jgi:phosphoserine phosphatase
MQYVVVFSTSTPQSTLSQSTIANLIKDNGPAILTADLTWLAPGKAAQTSFGAKTLPSIDALREAAAKLAIDVNVLPAVNRRKKLLIADMDSTIITDESLDEMANIAGFGPAVTAITQRSMNGELDFEAALDERVAMFAGKSAALFDQILAATVLTDGARTLVQTMRGHGAHCYLVSGGFMPIAVPIAAQCGFHAAHANEMLVADGLIQGVVKKPTLGRDSKMEIMTRYCGQHALHLTDAAAIGDGANDLAMLQSAGMGVAFHGKAMLRRAVPLQLNHTDLRGLLYLQGYGADSFHD